MIPINRKTLGAASAVLTLTAGAVLFLGEVIVRPLARATKQFRKEAEERKAAAEYRREEDKNA